MDRLKRGGGRRFVPLDAEGARLDEMLPAPGSSDPGQLFDRAWRRDLLALAVERVRRRSTAAGKQRQFQAFEQYDLCPDTDRPTYPALAERLSLKPSDVHNYLLSMREEIRSEVRSELARLTSSHDQLEAEWNAFIGA